MCSYFHVPTRLHFDCPSLSQGTEQMGTGLDRILIMAEHCRDPWRRYLDFLSLENLDWRLVMYKPA